MSIRRPLDPARTEPGADHGFPHPGADAGAGFFVGPAENPDAFELLDEGLRGGEGITWRARYRGGLATPVTTFAVKQLVAPPGARIWPTRDDWSRWNDQRRVLQQVRHPHLVAVFDIFAGAPPHRVGTVGPGTAADFTVPYLVMEWIDGPTLTSVVEAAALSLPAAVKAVGELAQAVAALHSTTRTAGNPMLHRDIKPDNCILHPDRGLVLVDIGTLRPVEDGRDPLGLHSQAYAAPEVLDDPGAPRDAASDLYSVGAVAYFAVTGSAPPAHNPGGVRKSTISAARAGGARDPKGVAAPLTAMIATDPMDRPLSLTAWYTSLRRAVGDEPSPTRVARRAAGPGADLVVAEPQTTRRRLLMAGAAAASLGAVGGGAWLLNRRSASSSAGPIPSAPGFTVISVPSGPSRWTWQRTVGAAEFGAPAIVRTTSDGVFVGAEVGVLALDREDGRLRWSAADQMIEVADGAIYTAKGSRLAARTAASGDIGWSWRPNHAFVGATSTADVLYVTSETGVASAVRRRDGHVLWNTVLDRGSKLSSPVLIGGTLIISGEFDDCYGLSASSGTRRWQTNISLAATSVVPVSKEALAISVVKGPGQCVVIDARSGRQLWEREGGGPDYEGQDYQSPLIWPVAAQSGLVYLAWPYGVELDHTENESVPGWSSQVVPLSPPTLGLGRLLVGTSSGVSAIDAGTGRTDWTAATDGPVTAAPTVTATTVYAGASDGLLYAFDLRSGSLKWTATADAPIVTSPVVGYRAAHVVTSAGTLFTMVDAD